MKFHQGYPLRIRFLQRIFWIWYSWINLLDAVVCVLTLGTRTTKLPLAFALWSHVYISKLVEIQAEDGHRCGD